MHIMVIKSPGDVKRNFIMSFMSSYTSTMIAVFCAIQKFVIWFMYYGKHSIDFTNGTARNPNWMENSHSYCGNSITRIFLQGRTRVLMSCDVQIFVTMNILQYEEFYNLNIYDDGIVTDCTVLRLASPTFPWKRGTIFNILYDVLVVFDVIRINRTDRYSWKVTLFCHLPICLNPNMQNTTHNPKICPQLWVYVPWCVFVSLVAF